MVLPVELIAAMKERAGAQGFTLTAYVAELVRRDLGEPSLLSPGQLAAQLRRLQQRVEELERLRPDHG